MSFSYFSTPLSYIKDTLDNRKSNNIEVSKLNAWIRVTSGVGDGMVILSNPSLPLFYAANAIYGGIGADSRGTTGETATEGEGDDQKVVITDINGKEIQFEDDRWGRPRPIISGLDLSEGNNGLSKKTEFQITCFSRAQMEEIQAKFGEPGHHVFIEFGMNTALGVKGLVALNDTKKIVSMRNLSAVQEQRLAAEGQYDNFLGRITGGGLSIEAGEKYVVTVKLTGVGDLAAYLQGHKSAIKEGAKETIGGESFWWVRGTINDQKRQFQYFFNDLPSYNRTEEIKNLVNNEYYTQPYNFINFDEELREDMGDETVDSKIRNPSGEKILVPGNVPLIGEERFVKLDVLFSTILDRSGVPKIVDKDGNLVEGGFRYQKIPVRAHKHIFSTDNSKLLIPNKHMPNFGFWSVLKGEAPPDPTKESVEMDYFGVTFPQPSKFDPQAAGVFNELTELEAYNWGYLEDLYVNFDFAKGILDSKTNTTYDVFIQILNGLNAASNNFWQFEVEKHNCNIYDGQTKTSKVVDQLIVVDKAMSCPSPAAPPLTLYLYGEKSVFLEASLDSSIGGAMMGMVTMGKASQGELKVNEDGSTTAPKTGRGLFTNEVDWIAAGVSYENNEGLAAEESETSGGDEKEKIAAMYSQFKDRAGVYPKLINNSADDLDARGSWKKLGFFTYDDSDLLRTYQSIDNANLADNQKEHKVGQALLPIKFTFTIHGLSGWKRGDKFKVVGLPQRYDNGFFQVTSINQQVEGMQWKTQIEGQFRNVSS